jgi:hypothetical protein
MLVPQVITEYLPHAGEQNELCSQLGGTCHTLTLYVLLVDPVF